eukprot:TRINITY_DN112014_c0_g1_i1.p1 TRINITY_DN112014_c0_g1~~TRINITY_DN112014_c0_g1_i1.p1  ORF type:complete len:459 (-),score=80.17 TRINITY_DN112014_c0_g1_i1:163-1539(-)
MATTTGATEKSAPAAARRSATPPPNARHAVPAEAPGDGKAKDNMSDATTATSAKPSFKVIYMTVFLDFFANGIVLPVLQNHARHLGANGFNVGMVFTAYSAAQIPGSFIFGRLSDLYGRRPIILISLLMSTVTFALTLSAGDLRKLIIARGVAGFFSETSVCQAYIADMTTTENRAAALGHMGAFIGLAFVVGPMTGALLGLFGGFAIAVQFTVVVTALNLVYATMKLDESHGALLSSATESDASDCDIRKLLGAAFRPVVAFVVIGQFLITWAFMGWDTTFALWANSRLGYEQRHTGWAFAWLAVGFFLASWKTRSFAKNPANTSVGGLMGCGLMTAGLLAHRLIGGTVSMLPPLFGIGFGYALSEIVFQTLLSVHTPKTLQGSLLGLLSASQALARAVAPLAVGHLFDIAPAGDLDFAYMVSAAAPALAALITLAAYATMPPLPAAETAAKQEKAE